MLGSNKAAVALRSSRLFGRFFRSSLPQRHVALSGEYHANSLAADAHSDLSAVPGAVLIEPDLQLRVVPAEPFDSRAPAIPSSLMRLTISHTPVRPIRTFQDVVGRHGHQLEDLESLIVENYPIEQVPGRQVSG